MKPIPIPVRSAGPGSQPVEDEDLQMLHIPTAMDTFRMPQVPDDAERAHRAGAAAVIERLIAALGLYRLPARAYPRLELKHLDPAVLEVLNQVLGEGEVSARVAAPRPIEIQETVFAGVWRVRHRDGDGGVVHDFLEACAVPDAVRVAAAAAGSELTPAPLTEVMNAPALLKEIGEQARGYRPGQPAHVVNLTLLPLSPGDHACLDHSLGEGAVTLLSRGFGKCRISSTVLAGVWRVRYFNSMDTVILDTIEVVDVPEVAQAAQDDLDDTLERLQELLSWLNAG